MIDPPAASIGVFDSGVGGLSVWRELVRALPHESTLYFADQAHIPYGPRPAAEIRVYAEAITRFLLDQGARVIVIACNTASAAALWPLRAAFPNVPFVGMEPAVKPAAEHTETGNVGVLATPTTIEGPLFRRLVDRFGKDVNIHTQICPGLVEAIENGDLIAPTTYALLERCLRPLLMHNIDHLVLGCTHYPFVRSLIEQIAGSRVTVIDPAPAVARQVRRILSQHKWLNQDAAARHRFITSGDSTQFAQQADYLVSYIGRVEQADWQDGALRIA